MGNSFGWSRVVAAAVAMAALTVVVPAGGSLPQTASAQESSERTTDVAGPPGVLPPGGRWTVTLMTGDVLDVRADGDGRVAATPRVGSATVRSVREPDGDVYAIPYSVTPLVERTLDLELFNVTGLIRQGYDDASSPTIPVIVQGEATVEVRTTLAVPGDGRPLPSIGAVAVDVPKRASEATGDRLAVLGADAPAVAGTAMVWLDRQVKTQSTTPASTEVDHNITQVGADRAWAAGYRGAGMTVAVLDTGIDSQHPDLVGKVVTEANFSDSPDAADRVGHGTHVASIVAGSGAASAGAHQGVAPDAELISGKVLDDFGFGTESQLIAGMEWAAPQADVVNMSLGAALPSDGSDLVSMALDALTDQYDTLFVVAAGNDGPLSRSVGVPGAADRALTVGAVDGGDALAEFSSRGPLPGSYELKPEVVAPGVGIVAARAAGTALGVPVGDQYTRLSGTSMATPHVAGAAALLAQRHPDWSAEQLKNGLVAASDPVDGDGYAVGAGRVDVGDAIDASVRAERDVVDLTLSHPHDQPSPATLSWTNNGDAPQTLHVDAEMEDRRGEPVDATTITPSVLSLAPGATTTAVLEIDGAHLDDGLYTGVVTADPVDGAEQDDLRTPIAVHASPPMVDLTIDATPPAGANTRPRTFALVANLDDYREFADFVFFDDGTETVTVPAGRYAVIGDVTPDDFHAFAVAQVGDPDVTVTQDTTVWFDGASAAPLHPTVPGVETAPPMYSASTLLLRPRHGTAGFGLALLSATFYPMPPIRLTPMEADPDLFAASQTYRLQAPHLTVTTGEAIEVSTAHFTRLDAIARSLVAVDAGDGSDLAAARGALAVVQFPAEEGDREAITRRAVEAGVEALAFVDEARPHLTLFDSFTALEETLVVIGAGGSSASTLRAAAAVGDRVVVRVAASPYVYDVVSPFGPGIELHPVVERRRLARLDERFHRDPGRSAVLGDVRFPLTTIGVNLWSEGPLPRRRTAYVTPDVVWASSVVGQGILRAPDGFLFPSDSTPLSVTDDQAYEAGSRATLTWLRRPMAPGPVSDHLAAALCEASPVSRTSGTLHVWLAPLQDGPNRFGCAVPESAQLTLSRGGTPLGSTDANFGDFAVPADGGTFRLAYEQSGDGPYAGPYPHRSSTAWTFHSAAPEDPTAGPEPIPLLDLDYDLPLDTRNRLTGRTANVTVRQVEGTTPQPIHSVRVWTSTDDDATWRRATVRRTGDGTYRFRLPSAPPWTGVSLRVAARDSAGNTVDQTIHDAYTVSG